MKDITLALYCDEDLILHDGKYYAENVERRAIFDRYLRVFDKIRLVLRCREEKELGKRRVIIDDPRIECYPIPHFQGPVEYAKVYFKVGKLLKYSCNGCDAAMLRIPSTLSQRVFPYIKDAGIPYACEVVFDAQDGYETARTIKENVLWRIIHRQMKAICRSANGVSCVTEKYLQRNYFSEKENHFVSNYSSLSLPASFYNAPRTFCKKDRYIAAHVSNQIYLEGVKGYKEVLDSLVLLKNSGINLCVRFAGYNYNNGVEKIVKYAENRGIADNIEYVGYVNKQELSALLDNADMFIFPTKVEGLPRVLIEAMAKGLPVVSTPASGIPEMINEHFLVGYYDVQALADRIKELLESPKAYEQASKENYQTSLKYEASILEARRDDFYKKLYDCCPKE
jgi:glycosyltransferase involved in cell wall biosynthesis